MAVPGKITIVQPSVPSYRVPFFNRLREHYGNRFSVYASMGGLGVLTQREKPFVWERWIGPIKMLPLGVEWQAGALSIPVSDGDVLVVSGSPRTVSTYLLLLKAKLRGAKIVILGHFRSSTSRPWRMWLRLKLLCLADIALFYTDREVESASRVVKCGKHFHCAALNNGLDTKEISAYRHAYVAKQRERRLLFIGRLTEKAQLDVLLRAMAQPELTGVCLDVIGSGDLLQELQEMAGRLGLKDRVVWHGGMIDEQKIAAVANCCRLFVYPGAVGLSLIHGLAYGLPAVIHDDESSHMPEYAALEDGENGARFEMANSGSLAATIASLVDEEERLNNMSNKALETTSRSYNTENMAERFFSAIRQLETCNTLAAPR